jgi:L-ascorbate metabolism protein UlaG (beta-lactamase superfamily)
MRGNPVFASLTASFLFILMLLTAGPALAAEGQAALQGDTVATEQGDLIIKPLNHATFVMQWQDKTIYVDPVGGAERFGGLPEMRALKDIRVAFVPMNLPFTMTVQQAADAARAFKPDIVYPYHHRGSDVQEFARLVGNGSEVRLGDWY